MNKSCQKQHGARKVVYDMIGLAESIKCVRSIGHKPVNIFNSLRFSLGDGNMPEIKSTVNEMDQLQNQVDLRVRRIQKRVEDYIALVEKAIQEKKQPTLPTEKES